MESIPKYWANQIEKRKNNNSLRELKVLFGLVDFYSNDYLGIAKDPSVMNMVNVSLAGNSEVLNGSTGSRLLSGNHSWIRRCEYYLSEFYLSENALVFNSGFDANLSVMSVLGGKEDTIIYDELVHASIRDGIRLSKCRNFSFKHNNLDDLEKKIKQGTGEIFIVTESIFSMDGDVAPLVKMTKICQDNSARLIVDEAHAIGIYGKNGSGLVQELAVQNSVFLRIVTFGKGAGVHGAAAICSDEAKEYLVNFCRPFIYSTAMPPADCIAIMAAHEVMINRNEERLALLKNVEYFRKKIKELDLEMIEGNSPICAILIKGGNNRVKQICDHLVRHKLGVLPVLSPTVSEGKERIRIIIHSFNTNQELDLLIEQIDTACRTITL